MTENGGASVEPRSQASLLYSLFPYKDFFITRPIDELIREAEEDTSLKRTLGWVGLTLIGACCVAYCTTIKFYYSSYYCYYNYRKKKLGSMVKHEAVGTHSYHVCLLGVAGCGAIIGTGIFVLTGTVAALHSGPAVVLSFLIGKRPTTRTTRRDV